MPRTCSCVLLVLALFCACDSKITSIVDADLQKRVDTVQDCFPGLYAKAQAVLDVAASWKLQSNASIPDPAGLVWSEQPNGEIDVTYPLAGCTLTMTIAFYSPTGVPQNLDLTGAMTLADAVDLAATQLRNLFGSDDKFMVGSWLLNGTGISGAGALTGIIGGSTNQNELEELSTTLADPLPPPSGPPVNANSTIADDGPPACMLTFNTRSLVTDGSPTQQYPIGTIGITIVGPEATVTATINFDGTVIAAVVVANVPGRFDFNLETKTLTLVP